MISFTHVQNIICSQTLLDGIAHEQTIICRQLFAGHVGGSRPMKRKKNLLRMIMLIATGEREAAFLLKTVKRMLCLGYVLLRNVLIYNLKVSFNFHTFLQLNVIEMFTEL